MKYDVILFDLDDTLFDFGMTERNAFHQLFLEYGLPNGLQDYLGSYKSISKVLWDELEQGVTTLEILKIERFKRLFLEHNLKLDLEAVSHKYIENLGREIHLISGVEEMLASLAGSRLAILTNGFQIAQHARIKSSPLKDVFEAIITSEEAGYQKPQPAIFEYTFKKLEITEKSKVLMVGDSLTSDIQGGNHFGIDTCWFNPNQKENTTTIIPTYEIENWSQLNGIVNGQLIEK
ncbi:YjjG family noncanonical pyrimidine nucleotidase [Psychrobacillus sp. MER TA 171]|uniref:YjjG family noncanonical pyrimidine nucleotidase n=1 Tax=Psychrobacillus sp. MER TA 171 TaxID=2939577 RepID=UPI00203B6154|nr:YjjG family noncanonical pyrimidine nucleotidase [Psychrobacillus sp. MER TA 171]MCM3359518.1 YjjG family noncanonical pyrimidine nucleotidase [Psychrobacillus sp. MER TA 171]